MREIYIDFKYNGVDEVGENDITTSIQILLPMNAIAAYWQNWQIEELALFGSVLQDDFNVDSDIDVLITFAPQAHPTLFTLVEMADALENLFGRRVDLVTRGSVEKSENYICRHEVLSTAQVIYAAS